MLALSLSLDPAAKLAILAVAAGFYAWSVYRDRGTKAGASEATAKAPSPAEAPAPPASSPAEPATSRFPIPRIPESPEALGDQWLQAWQFLAVDAITGQHHESVMLLNELIALKSSSALKPRTVAKEGPSPAGEDASSEGSVA